MSFNTFNLNTKLLSSLEDLNFTSPTPIQKMAIPLLMEGGDVLAAAATGSGKTAAFLLPIMHALLQKPRGKTRALVLTPTRELAAQIVEHFNALATHTKLKAAAVYGGVGKEPQVQAFKRGVDLIAATPGRLLDHFQSPYARLEGLEVLVLDEADRMLDMGFLPDVRRILAAIPKRKQTMLFSATMPQPIIHLSREVLKDPTNLNIERKSSAAAGIRHSVFPVPEELKKSLLLHILKNDDARSVLTFTRTKHRANRLTLFLSKHGILCERIHGNRSQLQRTAALKGFKDGRFRVLVATDIAARGIDVEALDLVVNFDVPNVPDDYIHRVGRTARADLTGDAYSLVSPAERGNLHAIERHISQSIPRRKMEGFNYSHKPSERFEVPLPERIAAIRARKAEERARAREKAQARSRRKADDNKKTPGRRDQRSPVSQPRVERPAAAAGTAPSESHKPGNKRRKPKKYYSHSLSNYRSR